MSDIKLYNYKKGKIVSRVNLTDAKIIIEKSLHDVFKIDLLAKDYYLEDGSNDAISYLGIDENLNLVIIEYRYGKFGSLTNKGLYFIDYIKDHLSKFKMLVGDYQKDIINNVNYNARLLIFCDDANAFDAYAIKKLPYTIELVQMHFYEDNVAFEKVYQSRNLDHTSFKYTFNNPTSFSVYKEISDFLLSLGDEVIETGIGSFLIYRKINTFAYLLLGDEITLKLATKEGYTSYIIRNIDDFEKITKEVEKAYDEC